MPEEQQTTERPILGEVAWADPTRMWRTSQNFISYNPSLLVTKKGLSIFDKMRQDDQVKAALNFKKHAILSTGWEVISPEGKDRNWEVTEFVYWVLSHLEETLDDALLELLSAIDYGFAVSEKVWGMEKIPMLKTDREYVTLKTLKGRKPHSFEFEMDDYGNLKRLIQQQSQKDVSLPIEKFVVFTYEKEFGNWYGKSDLEAAYRPWWAKHNAYQWLVMYLERLGIPPVFALYDPNSYSPNQKNDLRDIMINMQAATFGILPRPNKPDTDGKNILDFWTPELASQAKDVFMPALDMFNSDIARAVLMPGLIGFTPDGREGSYARSKKHFDVFMMVVEYIRRKLERRIVYEQLIKEIVDMNFTVDDYPIFKFLPMTDEVRADLLDRWIQAVEKGIVLPQFEDETHIRTLLRFPEKDNMTVPPGPTPPKPAGTSDKIDSTKTPTTFNKESNNKDPVKMSFSDDTVLGMLDRIEVLFTQNLQDVFNKMMTSSISFIDNNWDDRQKWVDDLKLKYLNDLQEVSREYVRLAYNKGEESVEAVNVFSIDSLKLVTKKASLFSTNLKDSIIKECKVFILNSLSVNESKEEVLIKIKSVFASMNDVKLFLYVRSLIFESYNCGVVSKCNELGSSKIKGVRYKSKHQTLDGSICGALKDKVFELQDSDIMRFTPPNHFGCQSRWIPVFVNENVNPDEYITEEVKGYAKDLMPATMGGK